MRRFALAAAVLGALSADAGAPAGAEILWDRWGVPHIYAPEEASLGYAFGWAQAEAHGDLLLSLYGRARGRAAEYWGQGNLENDRWLHRLGIPETAERAAADSNLEYREYLDGFVAGVNAYARAHAGRITDSLEVVLPVTRADLFAHELALVLGFVGAGRTAVGNQTRRWRETGSNAWAVAPSRSASGHALLLANPHLPWSGEFTWFEAHQVTPEGWLYGAALVGSPVLQIAFNERLGWTHTTNSQDITDLYDLTVTPEGYRYNGATHPFEESRAVLRVREGARHRLDTLRIRRSVHGPIVAERGGGAMALRSAGLSGTGAFAQWLAMGRARNLAEFERAAARLQVPSQNTTYADADGHILYHYGGTTPVRPMPNRAAWTGLVRGDTSATLWTSVHGYADMPRVLDPPSGWLQNTNDPPWSSTVPPAVLPAAFPPYFAPLTVALRTQRSIRLMQADSSITFEEFVAYKHSTRMETAERLLDDLAAAVRVVGTERSRRAMDVLARWDREANAESRGAVLFREWWQEVQRRMRGGSPYARPWTPQAPLETPDGLAQPDTAVAALDAAAERVERLYGALDVLWGDAYRLRWDRVNLPANGADLGVFRNVGYDSIAPGRFAARRGDSYVAAIEFGSPVRAATLVSYGNWSQPGSPHRGDQLALFSRKQLRPAWLTRPEVEANLERRERL